MGVFVVRIIGAIVCVALDAVARGEAKEGYRGGYGWVWSGGFARVLQEGIYILVAFVRSVPFLSLHTLPVSLTNGFFR